MKFLSKPTEPVVELAKIVADIEAKLVSAEADAQLMRVDLKAVAPQRLADGSLRVAREDLQAVEAEVVDLRLALESAQAQLQRAEQVMAAECLAARWSETASLLEERSAGIELLRTHEATRGCFFDRINRHKQRHR